MTTRAGYHTNEGAVAGDTLSGAASGAGIGAAGGPFGAAIGGVVGAGAGFLTGLFTAQEPDALPPPEAPPPALDLADALSKRAEIARLARLQAEDAGTFVSGPGGDTSTPPTSAPRAGGK